MRKPGLFCSLRLCLLLLLFYLGDLVDDIPALVETASSANRVICDFCFAVAAL